MNRRQLLKGRPVAALGMVAVAEGVHRVEIKKPGHFVFFYDCDKVDVESLVNATGLMPEGSTGGWLIPVMGDVEGAVKIFQLDGEVTQEDLPHGAIPIQQG
jgi:hypothetical protein